MAICAFSLFYCNTLINIFQQFCYNITMKATGSLNTANEIKDWSEQAYGKCKAGATWQKRANELLSN